MVHSDDSSRPDASRRAERPTESSLVEAARIQVAERLIANQATLLSFIRLRLGHAAAGERSAEDVFSTTLRRSDALVRANSLLAELPDAALVALASTISHRAILESSRRAARTRRVRNSAVELSRNREQSTKGERTDRIPSLDAVIRSALSEDDLAILVLRLDDRSWSAIAAVIGTTPAGAHRRYYRALKALATAVHATHPDNRDSDLPPTR